LIGDSLKPFSGHDTRNPEEKKNDPLNEMGLDIGPNSPKKNNGRKIPSSVLRPHSEIVILLKSIYEDRP
jgi:hypothetical protein